MTPTTETALQPGERAQRGNADCIWTGERWIPIANIEARLRDVDAAARSHHRQGRGICAAQLRTDATHLRALINGGRHEPQV